MEINNPQVFDHIIGINGEIIQPKVLSSVSVEEAKVDPKPVIWRKTTADEFHFSPGIATANGWLLRVKMINIGPWNMVADVSIGVAHGLTFGNIRTIKVLIRNDPDSQLLNINRGVSNTDCTPQGYVDGCDVTNVYITRLTGGYFDDTEFDDAVMNRGFITMWYTI